MPIIVGSALSVLMPGTGLISCLILFFFIKKLKRQYRANPELYKDSSFTMLRLANLLTWTGLVLGIWAAIVAFLTGAAATFFVFIAMMMGHKIGG